MQKLYLLSCGINFNFFINYYIWQLLTISHDYPEPVDKHDSDQTFTQPPGSKVKYLNFAITQLSIFF